MRIRDFIIYYIHVYMTCIQNKETTQFFQIPRGIERQRFIHHVFCQTKSAVARAFCDREQVYRKGKRKGQYTKPRSVTKNLFGIHGAAPFHPSYSALRSPALSRNRNVGLIDSSGPGTAKYSQVSFHGHCTTKTAFRDMNAGFVLIVNQPLNVYKRRQSLYALVVNRFCVLSNCSAVSKFETKVSFFFYPKFHGRGFRLENFKRQ